MADKYQLRLLKKGVERWNAWRKANLSINIDLLGADLRGADLTGADLLGAHLTGADLLGAHLTGADLTGAHLFRAHLTQADLTQASLREAQLFGADLTGAHLTQADLTQARLRGASLRGADLFKADLLGADLFKADLRGADLTGADLLGADLTQADLTGAHLTGAHLTEADLTEAHLTRADLTGADLTGAHLTRTHLTGADLTEAHLTGAHLTGAHLTGAHLSKIKVGLTTFINTDLSQVQGLDSIHHVGPSTIDIDTLYRSQGHIPESFLRGCGVPEPQIEYLPALISAMQPIQYHSCFISYSTKDELFAQRLHERMRAANLRVWYAPEEMKGGQKIHEQIDRAIQLHDRLLIVLSDASLHSEWVATEIRKARKAERREHRQKLFPIRLTSMETIQNWECFDADSGKDLGIELREYFIPDFSTWKEHDAFEVAFARLYNDLKTSTKALNSH